MNIDTDTDTASTANGVGSSDWQQDVRFAELMLRAFTDPATADRYTAAPHEVLGEFGIALTADTVAPALPDVAGPDMVREDFAGIGPAGTCLLTFSIAAETEIAQTADIMAAGH
jgi:hypothetical protein